MNVSNVDLGRVKALHHLLEEAHVGRAARLLGITPAAASNALRRLRVDYNDPLLIKKGRGLVRTRVGEDLREPARAVIRATERLVRAAQPFDPGTLRGKLSIALSEHVAAAVLPELDEAVKVRAPLATLEIAPIPDSPSAWLERTAGVLVGPVGGFAATAPGDGLIAEPLYQDRYVAAMRSEHPIVAESWTPEAYAALDHVLVVPRGRSSRSDIDEQLEARGLSRRIVRVVPSFTLAIPLVENSDVITTMPELYARSTRLEGIAFRRLPLRLAPLSMAMVVHPAHEADAAVAFIKKLLRAIVSKYEPDETETVDGPV